jgi:hypothetical protein
LGGLAAAVSGAFVRDFAFRGPVLSGTADARIVGGTGSLALSGRRLTAFGLVVCRAAIESDGGALLWDRCFDVN